MIPTAIPSAAPISDVTMLSCGSSAAPGAASSRSPQHPELARPLEDRQHQRVDDPEQAHDDRQASST